MFLKNIYLKKCLLFANIAAIALVPITTAFNVITTKSHYDIALRRTTHDANIRSNIFAVPLTPMIGRSGNSFWARDTMLISAVTKLSSSSLLSSKKSLEETEDDIEDADEFFDARNTLSLVSAQSLLIVISVLIGAFIGTPNYGLGPNFVFSWNAVAIGVGLTIPMALLSVALDKVEDRFVALQEVTKATQRSVISLMGGSWKPGFAFITSLALGCVAGVGEEMLFRGIFQYEIANRVFGGAASILPALISSIVFGLLHAVTPTYAVFAFLASMYFGLIYTSFDNLLIPIICHGVYDVAALMYAHWTVAQMGNEQRKQLLFGGI